LFIDRILKAFYDYELNNPDIVKRHEKTEIAKIVGIEINEINMLMKKFKYFCAPLHLIISEKNENSNVGYEARK
jgi:signal recognition particle GTPase